MNLNPDETTFENTVGIDDDLTGEPRMLLKYQILDEDEPNDQECKPPHNL